MEEKWPFVWVRERSMCSLIHGKYLLNLLSWNFYLAWWLNWQRIRLQCERPGFDPWGEKIPWRREQLPTPVFSPGEFHGLCSPRGSKESDTTEHLTFTFTFIWRAKGMGTKEQTWKDVPSVLLITLYFKKHFKRVDNQRKKSRFTLSFSKLSLKRGVKKSQFHFTLSRIYSF